MNIGLRGISGIESRMVEIQARMNDVLPSPRPTPSDIRKAPVGPIGGSAPWGPKPSGDRPINPYGPGFDVSPEKESLKELATRAAASAGVDPKLFDALIEQESGYNPRARSRAGAMGLSQLMPETAAQMGVSDPFSPWENLLGGAKYLRAQLDRFGDERLALAAYNAGPGAVQKHGGVPPYAETQHYVARILEARSPRSVG